MGLIKGPALNEVQQFQSWSFGLHTDEIAHPLPRSGDEMIYFLTAYFQGSFVIPQLPGSRDEEYRRYDNADLRKLNPQTWLNSLAGRSNHTLLPLWEPTIQVDTATWTPAISWVLDETTHRLVITVNENTILPANRAVAAPGDLLRMSAGDDAPERCYEISEIDGSKWLCNPGIEPIVPDDKSQADLVPKPVTHMRIKVTNQPQQFRGPFRRGPWDVQWREYTR